MTSPPTSRIERPAGMRFEAGLPASRIVSASASTRWESPVELPAPEEMVSNRGAIAAPITTRPPTVRSSVYGGRVEADDVTVEGPVMAAEAVELVTSIHVVITCSSSGPGDRIRLPTCDPSIGSGSGEAERATVAPWIPVGCTRTRSSLVTTRTRSNRGETGP